MSRRRDREPEGTQLRAVKQRRVVLKRTLILCLTGLTSSLVYAQQQTPPAAAPAAAAAAGAPAAAPAGGTMTPVQRADSAPQGSLKNPYQDTDADAVAAGGKLYLNY